MRVRKLDQDGDYQFGHGAADFWHNQTEGIAQNLNTRLLLFAGEWFLDTAEGTPWGGFPLNDVVVAQGRILGSHTQLSRDVALKQRVLSTDGVTNILNYSSSFDPSERSFDVTMSVNTIYTGILVRLSTSPGGFQLNVDPIGTGGAGLG